MSDNHGSTFMRGTAKADRLLKDPFYAEDVAALRAGNEKSDKAYFSTLREVRDLANLSQADLADRMDTDQGSVSRIERRNDMKVSTLVAYLKAVGGDNLRLALTSGGVPIEIDLSNFDEVKN